MTEKDLIDLGFERTDIPDSESQNGYNYYFYSKQYCDDITLFSTDSIDVKDDVWKLSCYEIPAIEIVEKPHYEQFIEILDNIICE